MGRTAYELIEEFASTAAATTALAVSAAPDGDDDNDGDDRGLSASKKAKQQEQQQQVAVAAAAAFFKDPESFEEFFSLYGGQQLHEELMQLSNECARTCNRSRAKLEPGQQVYMYRVIGSRV